MNKKIKEYVYNVYIHINEKTYENQKNRQDYQIASFNNFEDAKKYVYRTNLSIHYIILGYINKSSDHCEEDELYFYNNMRNGIPVLSIRKEEHNFASCSSRLSGIMSEYDYRNFIISYDSFIGKDREINLGNVIPVFVFNYLFNNKHKK